jgi:hypothetical protein
MKRRIARRRIAALALALFAYPATALAAPQDLRHQAPSSSLGVPPELVSPTAVPQYLPTRGTDVAAPDQQSSPPGVSVPTESASASSGFDWADAGIGAAGAASLFGIALAGALSLRRRSSALAG